MPGSMASMAVQKSAIPPLQPPRSTEKRTKGDGAWRENDTRANPRKITATPRPKAVAGGPNIDERLKAARERREEQQRLLAWRVQSRQEREQRARLHYEQQLQERQRKLKEQKIKEERRRCAVEEKRKQRLQEEKERNESAMRRTQEKSQKAQQNFGQTLRGRKPAKNVSFYSTTSSSSSSTPQRPQEQKPHIQRPQNQRIQNQRPQEQKPQNQRPPNQRPQPHKPQNQRPQNRRLSPSPGPSHSQTRSTNHRQLNTATQQDANRRNQNMGLIARPPPNKTSRTASSPSPEQAHRRSSRRHSIPLQLDLPSVPEEDVPICTSALSPGNSRPARIEDPHEDKMQDSPEAHSDLLGFEAELESRTAGDGSPSKVPPYIREVQLRHSAGTTDPEEASRLLAEKRREARLLREREEQDRLQAAEAEMRSHEELERRRAEERACQQAEAQRLIADKKRREEEEQRRAEEERAQAMREAALLLKQREEEQAREREKAAQLTKERELLAQKEEAERQVRKKRLEEIMRRTRRTSSPDTKSATVSILPKENSELPVHSGAIKDAVRLPAAGSRPQQLVLDHSGDDMVVPVVAFKERRSVRTLAGLEDIQTHQRAEVI
ncbi:ensconsin-like isoform X3 [Dunckerocampus dactyliophorus]|uniref:ensconsin-like isoform X3 n=1 Tax=Dunckerocampus dactyliophorus TaxID=161453 RepID=UPI0024069DE9|nr:ensconsin-like isoform X3 [Dunckerocampus dactyliophorus]